MQRKLAARSSLIAIGYCYQFLLINTQRTLQYPITCTFYLNTFKCQILSFGCIQTLASYSRKHEAAQYFATLQISETEVVGNRAAQLGVTTF
jgi:hypothetical protein